ncbi:MAG TPA: epimerase [Elusimicrobia bacterium]|nr:MAG: hypothetical protein A2016_11430 [Elusimicrobia bacterium GWF2_62_30]HBA61032.1 epimerase [Elusimicrobiota bacterium]
MNVLLTGATGFLGSHILEMLLSGEGIKVTALKRSFSSLERITHLVSDPSLKMYDIDRTALPEIFAAEQIDTIIHAATEYGRGDPSCIKAIDTNLVFPVQLIEEGIKHGLKTFINTDSYFNKENLSYFHLINYSLSKKVFLKWLHHFSKSIKVCNLVLEHLYGEGDSRAKFVPMLIDAIAVNPQERLALTYGHQKRDFVYVSDVVSAYRTVVDFAEKNSFRFKTFEVGTGVSTSIKEFAETVKEVSGSPTFLDFGALPYRDDEIMNSFADPIELKNLGWKPAFSLKEGLSRTVAASATKKGM